MPWDPELAAQNCNVRLPLFCRLARHEKQPRIISEVKLSSGK